MKKARIRTGLENKQARNNEILKTQRHRTCLLGVALSNASWVSVTLYK